MPASDYWPVFKLHLNDEIPQVGSGHRWVRAKVGWKWVRVIPKHYGKQATRIRRSKWDLLDPEPVAA